MPTVAIVYFSAAGHTKVIAERIHAGAAQVPGITATIHAIDPKKIVEGRFKDDELMAALGAADGIIFGCPTYMGGVAAQYKAFVDAASAAWFVHGWKDKVAAGFTHSMSPAGDKQTTLLALFTQAMQQGMIWVGQAEMPFFLTKRAEEVNRVSSFTGLMANSLAMSVDDQNPPAGDRLTAELFGKRVAGATARWVKGK